MRNVNNIDSLEWMKQAQDYGMDDGFSSHYEEGVGWHASYPEVTGYIIPTMIKIGKQNDDNDSVKRGIRAANWLLSIQNKSGSFNGRLVDEPTPTPVVFNTGMIIFGLLSVYRETNNTSYLNSAIRAGNWLVDIQESYGVWEDYNTMNGNCIHMYHTRVSWALLELYDITKDEKYFITANRNLNFALENQLENGWFQNASLTDNNSESPLLHFVAYTIRGILESGIMLNNEYYIETAKKSAESFGRLVEENGTLYGRYDKDWNNTVTWECLTGILQVAIIFLRLYKIDNNKKWVGLADVCINKVTTYNKGFVSGSFPIDGPYMPNCYLSWATKFLIDAKYLRGNINEKM